MTDALLEGLLTGGLIGLAAAGLTMLWRITGLLNLAQGALVLVGAYVCLEVSAAAGLGLVAGVLAATAVGLALGYVIQRGLLNLLSPGATYLGLAGAYGLGLAIRALLALLFSADYQSLPSWLSATDLVIGGLALPLADLLAFAVALAATAGLQLTLARTRLGLALRAVGIDREAGRMIGLPAARLLALAAALSTCAATLAGCFVAITTPFDPGQADHLIVLICAAAAIGRLGNVWGAFAAGVALGGAQGAVGYWAPPELTDMFALALMLVVLGASQLRRRYGPRSPRLVGNSRGPSAA